MKRLLSVLLAVCMVVGVGVCGTVGAGAAVDDEYVEYLENLLLALEFIFPAEAYALFEVRNNPVIEAEINAGIKKPLDSAFATGFQARDNFIRRYQKVVQVTGGSILEWDFDVIAAAYANGTLETDSAQVVSDLDILFNSYFTSAFMSTFNAYRAAVTKGFSALVMLTYRVEKESDHIANLNEIIVEANVFWDWLSGVLQDGQRDSSGMWHYGNNGLDKTGNLAQHTAFWLQVEVKAKAIWDKIEYTAPPEKWWEPLPTFVQWILRYLLFGWIWMR